MPWKLNKMPWLAEQANSIVKRWGFVFTHYRGHNGEICEIWDPTLNRWCGGGYLTVEWYYRWSSDIELAIRFRKLLLRGWLADAILERYELTHKDNKDNA